MTREPGANERPVPSGDNGVWGSDVVVDLLRELDIPWVALNPGASFRGLHDSLVNRLGNERPQMLLCLHEEAAVAIAHGWAKVTERAMAAVAHSNVGLMHATMAVFNAWCDRAPLLLLGATGPVDAAKRRPWIDWIHTARDQGALVRNFTKWDDQPASIPAAIESILRAWRFSEAAPQGPTYVCLDAALQEQRVEQPVAMPEIARYRAPPPAAASAELVERAAQLLRAARRPAILMGRVSRAQSAWDQRVEFAERLGATVFTDMKTAAAFPTDHPLLGAVPSTFASPGMNAKLREADVILVLDWIDLAGTLKSAWGQERIAATIIDVSLDRQLHNGWSMDHQGLPPVDLAIEAAPDPTVAALLAAMQDRTRRTSQRIAPPGAEPIEAETPLRVPHLAAILGRALAGRPVCLMRHPLSWAGHLWPVLHPLDFLGTDGGGGIGSGPGNSVGAALALRGGDRLPLAILGDGDFLMGVTAVWTAVHYAIPLIIVVANNRSFYNDEVHQERVAQMRGRPVENKWIGQHIREPDVDLAMIARGQGATAFGPVRTAAELEAAFSEALRAFGRGETVVIDARVEPGYDPGMASALAKGPERS
ncbi:MAG TPA: thiamine pyrophosphate-binding protein [Beijerinckiaceae bacterium]|nr:thiamine pyrophosphate-binding protein [Beijerinckiaceae bacterium]